MYFHKVIFTFILLSTSLLFFCTSGDQRTSQKNKLRYSDSLNLKKVFVHYMVCNRSYGSGSLEGYKQDIRDAQEMGIDGFALNLGDWNKNYQQNVKRIFQAANELQTDFKLFLSPDGCCGLNNLHIIEMFRKYARDPGYFYYENRPFLSAYSGAQKPDWWLKAILQPLDSLGFTPYFVPYFYPEGYSAKPDESDISSLYNNSWKYLLDGYFYFGAAALPEAIANSGEVVAAFMHNHGKTYMAPVSPYYWGSKQTNAGRRFFDYKGGEGLSMQWESIINNQKPEWVELVTWNDWDEGSYFSPIDDISKYWNYNASKTPGFYKTHKGFAELNKYYIEWYKAGNKPVINQDQLFVFYRTHPKDLETPADKKGLVKKQFGNVQDEIYITTLLKEPTELIVTSGKKQTKLKQEAGISHTRVLFYPGEQKFELKRKGNVILSLQGEEIQDEIKEYNFQYYSGFTEK